MGSTGGETIVMIHGMWGSDAYWADYKAFFEARGYRCLTPVLRHHGGDSAAPPHPDLGATSLLDYAADLQAELESLENAPILMGHSMGGLLAQILAARLPAKALVLLTPASPAGIFALRLSVIRSFRSWLTSGAFWRKAHRQTFGEAAYSMLHLLSSEKQREVYSRFGYESGRAASEIGFWLLDPRRASRVDERAVTCPVLVVAGGQDRITPAAVVRRVARKYGARCLEFPDHAHWVVGEPGWQDIAGAVAEWLGEQFEKETRPAP